MAGNQLDENRRSVFHLSLLCKPVIAPFRRGSRLRQRNLTHWSTPREANQSLSVVCNRHLLFTTAYKLDCDAGQISTAEDRLESLNHA